MRGYYLVSPGSVVEFPVAERWSSNLFKRLERDIRLQAERGRLFVYKQSSHRVLELIFRVTSEELEFFADLHDLLGGQETSFYFVFDVDDSSGGELIVRKEQNFDPQFVEYAKVNGIETAIWDYSMTLTQESDTSIAILA